jgi:hypothetical protein
MYFQKWIDRCQHNIAVKSMGSEMSFARKWMELEIIIIIEISQTQTHTECFLSSVECRFEKKTK